MSPTRFAITRADGLVAGVETHDWRFRRDNAGRIAEHWSGLVARKPAMFDGRVLLMTRATIAEEAGRTLLRSAHFETDFSAFIAWRDFGFPDPGVRNCFAMAALRGNDGGFVLAEMSAHTSNAGLIYFPAGTPDLEDVIGDRLDLEGSAIRELEEETGLRPGEYTLDPDWLLIDAGPRFACMKGVAIDAPATEIARELDARITAQMDPELARTRVARDPRDIDPARMPDFVVAYLEHMFARQPG